MKKYSWSLNEDEGRYSESCDTIEECIAEALVEYANEKLDGNKVYIGENKEIIPMLDVETSIDYTIDNLYENYVWLDDLHLYDSHQLEELDELQNSVNTLFHKWLKKYGYYPCVYSVENIKEYKLNKED